MEGRVDMDRGYSYLINTICDCGQDCTADLEYENRIVLYIDILGFKSAIEYSTVNNAFVQKIYATVHSIFNTKKHNENGYYELKSMGVEISTFSDNMVISYPLKLDGAVWAMLFDTIVAIVDILSCGFLVRGAITIGKLYHDGDVVFGPALNEAVNLEQMNAVYPRVIMSDYTLSVVQKQLNYSGDDFLCLLIPTDNNYFYIDFLSAKLIFGSLDQYKEWLLSVRELISNGIISHREDSKVLKKYYWFKEYFNKTVLNLDFKSDIKPIDN